MKRLEGNSVSCRQCAGTCCTFVANSMKITPSEALDIYSYLSANERWTLELKEHLQGTIDRFRLEADFSNGRKDFLRKTYTCPFFSGGKLGCGLPVDVKPYGCLGFNPKKPEIREGGACESDQGILERHHNEVTSYDQSVSDLLFKEHQVWWDKLYLPVALIELFKAFPPLSNN